MVPVLNGLLLQEEDMNTRIVAGQAVALLFELTRDLEEDVSLSHYQHVCVPNWCSPFAVTGCKGDAEV